MGYLLKICWRQQDNFLQGQNAPCYFVVLCAKINMIIDHRESGDKNMTNFSFLLKKHKNPETSMENSVSHESYREIMLQYQGKHMVYKPQQGLISYKNVISPRDGACYFPEGYFDVKTVSLKEENQKEIGERIDIALSQLLLGDTLDILPPGASHEALMICTKTDGDKVFYSNCHLDKSGFSVSHDPIDPSFFMLFKLLSSYCIFVEFPVFSSLESCADISKPQDKRYFEETLWICERCSTGNLMEHRYCIKCGKARTW